jgi:hypothetical protein
VYAGGLAFDALKKIVDSLNAAAPAADTAAKQ